MIYIVALFGGIIGSFLGMLIYRLPLEISLIDPKRSICPYCHYTLKWYENIPLISYLFLKGNCSNCKHSISLLYPIVELSTSLITVLLFIKLGFTIEFLIVLFIFYTLILLSFIDFKYKEVPDYILLLLIITLFIYGVYFNINNFIFMLAFVGGFNLLNFIITYYIQNIKSKLLKDESLKDQIALGEGDMPVIASFGILLNPKMALLAIFLSAIFAIIPAIFNIMIKKDIQTPFIPFLSLGLFVTYILGEKLYEIIS